MTYRLGRTKASKLPDKFMVGELLLRTNATSESPVFIYRGQRGNFMKLCKARFDKATRRLETIEEVKVHVRRRKQFSRLMGLVAVRA